MKRRVLGVFTAAVLSLATAGVALAGPASAASSCQSGTVPAVQAGQSNLRLQCVLEVADQSSRVQISDYPFARWHSGSARSVVASVTSATVITGATGSFSANDARHTITAMGLNQTCAAVPARAFIVSATATAATLNAGTLHTGVRAPTTVLAATTTGQTILVAAGTGTTNSFQACDVGRSITGTGIPAGAKIATFITAKLATMTVAATATGAAASKTLGPFQATFQVNNSVARDVQDATITSGSTALTSVAAHFSNLANILTTATPTGDVGNVVGGQCIADGTTILSVAGNVATLSAAATCTQASGDSPNRKDLSITMPDGTQSTARIVTDATSIAGNKFQSATANFQSTDIGQNIVKGTTKYLVTAVGSGGGFTTATVATALAASGTPVTITVGTPTATAPVNGDLVAQQATSLQLLTSLVAGAHPCADNKLQGTTIDGAWYNPGAFKTTGILGATGTGLPKTQLAEMVFPTSVTSFAAFLTPRAGGTITDEAGHVETQTTAHYDITFPFEPLGIAVCPGTTVSSDFTFIGTTLGTQVLPTGTGMPSTAIARGIQQVTGAPLAPQTAYVSSGTRTVGATTTAASTAITGAVNTFAATDAGRTVSGTCVTPGTTIASVTDSQNATLSAAALTTGVCTLFIDNADIPGSACTISNTMALTSFGAAFPCGV
jgi:hypothetical protein